MTNLLRQLAKRHQIQGITWFLMPYTTLRSNALVDEFQHLVPRETRGLIHESFLAIEGYTVDVEFAEELTEDEKLFQAYWQQRPANTRGRWELFGYLGKPSVVNGFWSAFGATRDVVVEAASDPE